VVEVALLREDLREEKSLKMKRASEADLGSAAEMMRDGETGTVTEMGTI